jgi:SAM-dependent methyltransferase
MSGHNHDAPAVLDAGFWNERYRSSHQVWSGDPNPQLVSEVAHLPAGRALDVGCGEGADAIWLASRGWHVVAVDISDVALERAAHHAQALDHSAFTRIEWHQADLLAEPPGPASFDLVSCQFMQLPPEPRAQLFTAVINAVSPGGTLLVVGHHPSDLGTGVRRPPMAELFYTGDDIAALLDDTWTVVANDARPRPATTPAGVEVTVHDALLRATRGPLTGSGS